MTFNERVKWFEEHEDKLFAYKFWLRYKLPVYLSFHYWIRKLRYSLFNLKFRIVARFIDKHSLWFNEQDAIRWKKYAKPN